MTLELKHLAPYLPYELNCQTVDKGEVVISKLNAAYSDNSYSFMNIVESEKGFEDIKPILRPLSDLTKDDKFSELINEELICGAWKFVHDDWTTSIQTSNNQHTLLIIQNEVAPECTVLFFNYMIENHYDVFGLIEQGLAIDINTLEK